MRHSLQGGLTEGAIVFPKLTKFIGWVAVPVVVCVSAATLSGVATAAPAAAMTINTAFSSGKVKADIHSAGVRLAVQNFEAHQASGTQDDLLLSVAGGEDPSGNYYFDYWTRCWREQAWQNPGLAQACLNDLLNFVAMTAAYARYSLDAAQLRFASVAGDGAAIIVEFFKFYFDVLKKATNLCVHGPDPEDVRTLQSQNESEEDAVAGASRLLGCMLAAALGFMALFPLGLLAAWLNTHGGRSWHSKSPYKTPYETLMTEGGGSVQARQFNNMAGSAIRSVYGNFVLIPG